MEMTARHNLSFLGLAVGAGILFAFAGGMGAALPAQTPAPAAAATPAQRGTVKAISGNTLTVATDAGASVTITVPDATKILQEPVGSTDLKAATPSQFSQISVGDRVLAAVRAGDTPSSFTAREVVVMKSADIAQMQAAQQADWKANGVGGIVSAVDPASGTITITSGAKKVVIDTSSKTVFKRFATDSVKYQDAKPGTLAQVQTKDQLQARGTKSADGTSIQAAEVVSGSFEDLSGLIITADAAAGKITLKDLGTKKLMTVNVTANSDLRLMPMQAATMFAARANGGGAGQGGGRGGAGGQGAGGPGADGGMRRSAGADLSQMIARFPEISLADLHKGDAVMIVASAPTPDATTVTASTVLTGVDPILTANPNGGMSLSMSIGGGGGDQ
jgi:hypothetical protein